MRQTRQKPGEGIAQHQTRQRGDKRHVQRMQQHLGIQRIKQPGVVVQGKDHLDEVGIITRQETGDDDHQVRQEYEQHKPTDDGGNHHILELTCALHQPVQPPSFLPN